MRAHRQDGAAVVHAFPLDDGQVGAVGAVGLPQPQHGLHLCRAIPARRAAPHQPTCQDEGGPGVCFAGLCETFSSMARSQPGGQQLGALGAAPRSRRTTSSLPRRPPAKRCSLEITPTMTGHHRNRTLESLAWSRTSCVVVHAVMESCVPLHSHISVKSVHSPLAQ